MATYHLTVNIGGKGKAGPHAAYISREGKYSGNDRYEDLESKGTGNMPRWAEHNPANFWRAADERERANGSTYREIEIALPRELEPEQRRMLVEDFIKQEIGEKHAYQWAIHTPKAALENGEQPHAHIMYSERTVDGIERDPEQYFKRYNAKNPEKGGARKFSGGKALGELKDELQATRQRWADVQNLHLERHGHDARVDHRSLKNQGMSRAPEKHIGPIAVKHIDVAALLESRAAVREFEIARDDVSKIDITAELAAQATAQAQREARADALAQAQREAAQAQRQAQAIAEATAARQATQVRADALAVQEAAARQARADALAQAQREAAQAAALAVQIIKQQQKEKNERTHHPSRAKEPAAVAEMRDVFGLDNVHDLQPAQDLLQQDAPDFLRLPEAAANHFDVLKLDATARQKIASPAPAKAVVAPLIEKPTGDVLEAAQPSLAQLIKESWERMVEWIKGVGGDRMDVTESSRQFPFYGSIHHMDDLHAVQKTSRTAFTIHRLADLDKIPAMGDTKTAIKYKNGVGVVTGRIGQGVEKKGGGGRAD